MKPISEFVAHLNKNQIKLQVEGDGLRYRAPDGALTPELKEQMRERKSELIKFLRPMGMDSIGPSHQSEFSPLSFSQQRLWFLDQLEEESFAYNLPCPLQIEGPLKANVLKEALKEILRRHEVLRTCFPEEKGSPIQKVCPLADFNLTELEGEGNKKSDQPLSKVMELILEDARTCFNLKTGPLVRMRLFRIQPEKHFLILIFHHIVMDGWSMGIFLRELSVLYEAFSKGKSSPLEELYIQYRDYSIWQQRWLETLSAQSQLAYWRKQLMNAPGILELPLVHPRPPIQGFAGKSQWFDIPSAIRDQLGTFAHENDVSLFMVLFSVFVLVLYRYSGEKDIMVGTSIANRTRMELEPLIGLFANTMVLRTQIKENFTFFKFLTDVRKITLDAYANQDIPFERVVEEVQPERSLSHTPLFQIMFEYQETAEKDLALSGVSITPMEMENVTAKFDLTLSMLKNQLHLGGALEYNTDIFDKDFVTGMIQHYLNILKKVLLDPNTGISETFFLTEKEKYLLLEEWNNTGVDIPVDRNFLRGFQAQVVKTPKAMAVSLKEECLTYHELNQRSNQLANQIMWRGVGIETLVPVIAERSIHFLIAIIGIFKTGGVYMPMDPHYPIQRQAHLLKQIQPKWIITQELYTPIIEEALSESGLKHGTNIFDLNTLVIGAQRKNAQYISRDVIFSPDRLAYVIFTSGSTGIPKGAMVEHKGMYNHLLAKIHQLGICFKDRLAQNASQCFDISVWQFLAPLLVGGSVHIFPEEVILDPVRLLKETEISVITILEVVPSVMRMMLMEIEGKSSVSFSNLRWLIPTGEALPPELARHWLKLFPLIPLLNAYGPTECSDDVTHYPIYQVPGPVHHNIPIGRPIDNICVYVLDFNLQLVPLGVTGELFISGTGVGRGYLNDPIRTAKVFIWNPFFKSRRQHQYHIKMYKSGDRVRYLRDGNIEFLGRIDHQVKVRGFRIELGEIESALIEHSAIEDAVVVAKQESSQLNGFIVKSEGQSLEESQLRIWLKSRLPEYMVPEQFVFLPEIPVTANGKVNRQKLLTIEAESEFKKQKELPQTETEKVLANLWAEILNLGIETLGIHDNFFQRGGHSLLAAQVINRIRESFSIEVTVRKIFELPSIAEMSEYIDNLHWAIGQRFDTGKAFTEREGMRI